MTLRVATQQLVALLTDLAHTAADPAVGGATAGIYLHCDRGHLGDEPGRTDLLVGTSTDGTILGHTYVACAGHTTPMVWPVAEVKVIIAALKPLAGKDDHGVEISHVGDVVTVAEDPDLFGERLSISFTGHPAAEFPVAGAHGLLTHVRTRPASQDGEAVPDAAPRTDISARQLAPFLKVASRRSERVELYRHHQWLPITVQIGGRYRGVLRPQRWDEVTADGRAPSGDIYPPNPAEASGVDG